jgi:cation diffusion facilitator CzcD-associated flavoprotein CzcO
MDPGDITALEARARRDIEMTAHPRMEWMAPRLYRGKPALDALIVGAGQSGLCVGFALMRDRVANILLIDRAPEGREGTWVNFARMPTLRSPKDQTGPDLGVASLTFEAGTTPCMAPAASPASA